MQNSPLLNPAFFSLRGSPALSTFRLEKQYASLKKVAPSIAHITTEFVHFVFSKETLTDTQQNYF
jgi:phosphoribosylformylglycinamidine synthase